MSPATYDTCRRKPASWKNRLRAAIALSLVLVLTLGNLALAGALEPGLGSMPCDMQMGAADHQLAPADDTGSDRGSLPPVCPMMVGGVCLMLVALEPLPVGIAEPPHATLRTGWVDNAVIPRIVPPLRRPPRSL